MLRADAREDCRARLQLTLCHRGLVDEAMLQDADGGDVGQGLRGDDVFGIEQALPLAEEVE